MEDISNTKEELRSQGCAHQGGGQPQVNFESVSEPRTSPH
jgi:hypothetical protein